MDGRGQGMTATVQGLEALHGRVRHGDATALAALFAHHRERLWRMAAFRLDSRLRGRVDPDDVVQEAYLDAAKRLRHYEGDSPTALFVWLRLIAAQTLVGVCRRHLGAARRDVGREVALGGPAPQATSASLAIQLVGDFTSPSGAAVRAETLGAVERAIDGMDPIDREVLALRHFEELTNGEAAAVLGIQPKAASIRYVRALRRLKAILAGVPGLCDEARDA